MLPTPPPLRRHVGERAAAFAEEARALTERSTELLVRIDELFSAPADGSIEAPMSGAAC